MLYDIDNVFECLKQQIKFDNSMPDRGFITGYDHRSDGMEWMQFTGLKDKNGKEIYENDLVQDAVLIFKVEWNEQNAKFCINPVGRVNGGFDGIIESIMYADLGNGYYSRKDLEIIGNIHENPELIK